MTLLQTDENSLNFEAKLELSSTLAGCSAFGVELPRSPGHRSTELERCSGATNDQHVPGGIP